MKTLIIIRHTKSDWSAEHTDFERPITTARQGDASLIATHLAKTTGIPQLVIASAAIRARQTAELFCKIWQYPIASIEVEKSIYMCTVDEFSAKIQTIDDHYSCVAVVAHNPTITDFVNQYADTLIMNMPTSSAVCIELNINHWENLNESNKGKVTAFLQPRDLL